MKMNADLESAVGSEKDAGTIILKNIQIIGKINLMLERKEEGI